MTIFERIAEIIKDKSFVTFFEFGACDGLDTGRILKVLERKSFAYYAFEADTRRVKGIGGLENHVGHLVNVVPKAIGSIDGPAKFHFSCPDYYGSGSLKEPTSILLKEYPKMNFKEGQVDVVRLDTFCRGRQIEHIDFIWSDIQGAERDMIEGGREMLERTDWLYTEYNDGHAYKGNVGLQAILDLLPKWTLVEDFGGDALLKNNHGE